MRCGSAAFNEPGGPGAQAAMVTIFATSPFVARIPIPLTQAQDPEEEQAALTRVVKTYRERRQPVK
jgi:ABC-type sulfate transport system permease subunit